MAKRPMLFLSVGLVLGILIGKEFHWYLMLAVIAVAAGVAVSLWKKRKSGYLICYSVLFPAMVLWGSLMIQRDEACYREIQRTFEDGMEIELQGRVCRRQTKEDRTVYELAHCYARLETGIFPCKSRIEAELSSDEYLIGTTLTMTGTVKKWSHAENEGSFDAADYYKSKNMAFCLTEVRVTAVYGKPSRIAEKLQKLKTDLKNVYQENMSADTAGVIVTMTLGDKTLLEEDLKAGYQDAGISHILAISGLHVSLIGMTIYHFLRRRRLSFVQAGIIAGIFLYEYGQMVGMGTSTQRAVLMFLLSAGAACVGRTYDSLNALGIAAIFLLAGNPFLLWDAGFLFSFSAVVGVVWIVRCCEKVREDRKRAEREAPTEGAGAGGKNSPEIAGAEGQSPLEEKGAGEQNPPEDRKPGILGRGTRSLVEKFLSTIFVSICIQLTTAPLTAYFYYEIPVYSAVLNALVLPVVGLVLGFGIIGGTAGLFVPALAKYLLLPCEMLLRYYNAVCGFNARLPGAVQITGRPPVHHLVMFYLVLIFWIFLIRKRRRTRYLVWGLCALALLIFSPKEAGFELDVLSVGQGDGIFLRSEDGVCFFIDGGSTSSSRVGTYRILPFLKSKGVREVSFWFVSHTDEDHISGLMEVLESGYLVEHLVFSDRVGEDEAFEEIVALAGKNGTKVVFMKEGERLCTKTAAITCLAPDAGYPSEDKNALSMVLLYEEDGFRGIFTGDISTAEEEYLLEQECVTGPVDFYKAAHHGSKGSNSKAWLEILSPSVSAISCGRGNRYGHPGAEAVAHMEEVGSTVYDTRMCGQIKLRKGGEGIVVEKYVAEE